MGISLEKYSERRALIKRHGLLITEKIYQVLNHHIGLKVSSIYLDLKIFPYFNGIDQYWEIEDISDSYIVSDHFASWLLNHTDSEGQDHIVTNLGDYKVWHVMPLFSGQDLHKEASIINFAISLIHISTN